MTDPPGDDHPTPPSSQIEEVSEIGPVVRDQITNQSFTEWYNEQNSKPTSSKATCTTTAQPRQKTRIDTH
uniref:hypothetical protein n=1 Tax=Halobacterium salinarum TaxID=2242 RepID=UPI00159C967C|nr:hypothetical protein [Halobacterium salinarum]